MIYHVRKHNDFGKVRDENLGAFSSIPLAIGAIRTNLFDSGEHEAAMMIDIPDEDDPFVLPCGLSVNSIRFGYGANPIAQFFEVKYMTLDGE